jgi:hypothetical protein
MSQFDPHPMLMYCLPKMHLIVSFFFLVFQMDILHEACAIKLCMYLSSPPVRNLHIAASSILTT